MNWAAKYNDIVFILSDEKLKDGDDYVWVLTSNKEKILEITAIKQNMQVKKLFTMHKRCKVLWHYTIIDKNELRHVIIKSAGINKK